MCLENISFPKVNIAGAMFLLCLIFKVRCKQCIEVGKARSVLKIASGKNLSRFGDASQRTSYFQPSTLFVQLRSVAYLSETKSPQPHFSY